MDGFPGAAMARANRHYIPGQIWHITHRCHERNFLLKLAKDRRRWIKRLHEAKGRYKLSVLNYTVTIAGTPDSRLPEFMEGDTVWALFNCCAVVLHLD